MIARMAFQRRLRSTARLLALGVLCTVASAWALALCSTNESSIEPLWARPAKNAWPVPTPRYWTAMPGSGPHGVHDVTSELHIEPLCVVVATVSQLRTLPPPDGWSYYRVERWMFGLPLPSLEYIRFPVSELTADIVGPDLYGGLALSNDVPHEQGFRYATSRYRLPIVPWWPEFVFNTVFYAALFALAPRAIRRVSASRRARRGLCPRCRYPVGVSPVCTECGSALRPLNNL